MMHNRNSSLQLVCTNLKNHRTAYNLKAVIIQYKSERVETNFNKYITSTAASFEKLQLLLID